MNKQFIRKIKKNIGKFLPLKIQSIIRFFKSDKYGKKYYWGGGNYLWVYPYLKEFLEIKTNLNDYSIIEIGSRDCIDACELAKDFNVKNIFVFEPSREGLKRCAEVLKENPKYAEKIILHGVALGKKNEVSDFFEFVKKDPWALNKINVGMSSLGEWTPERLPDGHRHKVFKNTCLKYKVPVLKGDNLLMYQEENYLLICIDVEGFELNVLKGILKTLEKTHFICLEMSYNINRKGLINDADSVHDLLIKNNFEIVICDSTGGKSFPLKKKFTQIFNVLYKNTKLNS